jgi:glycerol-3-phosphate dehydrogenase
MSLGKPLPANRVIGRKGLRRDWASLDPEGLSWAGIFEDAHVPWTERLCIELAISASDNGGIFLTRSEVVRITSDGRGVSGVCYRDLETGASHQIKARAVVNAAGPWVDKVLLGAPGSSTKQDRLVGPTKGSHIVVDHFQGAPDKCIFFEARADRRPMFILPWAGRYMLGSTDIPFYDDLEEIVASDEEIDYLLAEANALIPLAQLTSDDVLWSYAGVRPLPYVSDLSDPSKVTRDHQIIQHGGDLCGLITVVGGKITTHRALGEQTINRVVKSLGKGEKRSRTYAVRFPGAPEGDWNAYVKSYVSQSKLPEAKALRLVKIYGTRASMIERLIADVPELATVIDEDSGALAGEVVFAIREEGARTLEDILLRRVLVGLNADVGLTAAPIAAQIAVTHAGWSEETAKREVLAYQEAVRRFRPRAAERSARAEHE